MKDNQIRNKFAINLLHPSRTGPAFSMNYFSEQSFYYYQFNCVLHRRNMTAIYYIVHTLYIVHTATNTHTVKWILIVFKMCFFSGPIDSII